jgi:hypothetical protein
MHTLHGLFKKFTVKFLLLLMGCMAASLLRAQELYPYSEPASNMPAHSLAAKLGAMYQREWHDNRLVQRYSPEVMLGPEQGMDGACRGYRIGYAPAGIYRRIGTVVREVPLFIKR